MCPDILEWLHLKFNHSACVRLPCVSQYLGVAVFHTNVCVYARAAARALGFPLHRGRPGRCCPQGPGLPEAQVRREGGACPAPSLTRRRAEPSRPPPPQPGAWPVTGLGVTTRAADSPEPGRAGPGAANGAAGAGSAGAG